MIRNPEEFESALERLASHLESPPPEHTPADREFKQLLDAVEAYNPEKPIEGPPPREELVEQARALGARARTFQRQREARERRARWSSFPEDGQGIGPTTGV